MAVYQSQGRRGWNGKRDGILGGMKVLQLYGDEIRREKEKRMQETWQEYLQLREQNPNITRGQLPRALYMRMKRYGQLESEVRVFPPPYDEQDRRYRENYEGMNLLEIESVNPNFANEIRSLGLSKYVRKWNSNGNGNGKLNVNGESVTKTNGEIQPIANGEHPLRV